MLENILHNLTNIGLAMLFFLCAYLSNVAFSMYYNIKILLQPFDKQKIINSGLKIAVFVIGLTLLCLAITTLPLFADLVGWEIPAEYADIFSDLVIIGAVLLVSCKYIAESFGKFKFVLNSNIPNTLPSTKGGMLYPCKEDPNRVVKRVRYVCYGKTRKQTDCDGQTGYTAHILDGIIDKLVRQIFERMKAIPKSDIVNIRYREKMEERKSLLHSVRAEYAKAAADLETLKGEVIKTIRGESTFSKELLSSLIAEAEAKCQELQENMETAQAAYDEGQAVMASLNAQYDDIISWADMYDTASMETKKMIVNCLIKRIDVYRDYKLHIDFNIDFEQFSLGIDLDAIAA